MEIINALKSRDFVKLNAYFKGRISAKMNAKVESKVDEYKAKLRAYNAALKASAQK